MRMRLLLAILLVGVPLAGADFGVIATETEPPITIALPGTPATPAETDPPVAVTELPVTVIEPPVAVTEPPVPPTTEAPAVVTPATVAPTEKTVVIDPPPPPPTEDTIVIEPPTPPPTEEGGDSPVVVPPSDDGATTGPQWQWHTFNFTFRLYSDSMPTVDTGLLDVRTALEAQLSGDEAFVDQADLPSGTSIELDDLGTVKQGVFVVSLCCGALGWVVSCTDLNADDFGTIRFVSFQQVLVGIRKRTHRLKAFPFATLSTATLPSKLPDPSTTTR